MVKIAASDVFLRLSLRQVELLTVLFVIIELGGHLTRAYELGFFDLITHFTGGVMVAAWVWYIAQDRISTLQEVFVVLSAMGIGALWELTEFASDRLLGTMAQKSLQDTMTDLIMVLLGILLLLFLLRLRQWFWLHQKSKPVK